MKKKERSMYPPSGIRFHKIPREIYTDKRGRIYETFACVDPDVGTTDWTYYIGREKK